MSDSLACARVRESAERIVAQRTWGDTRNDAVAKRAYDAALACAADAIVAAEAEWSIERAVGQRQLDEATALMAEAAALFTGYAEHHKARASEPVPAEQQRQSLRKAHVNLSMALSLREWLAGVDPTLPLDDAVAVLMRARQAHMPPPLRPVLVIDLPGVTSREQAERHPQSHQQRFANREGYGSNVRPITDGPLAEPGVADAVVNAIAGDAKALGMAGPVFRLQTADPRFDPTQPVQINGYPYQPATEQ